MASNASRQVPTGDGIGDAAMQRPPWRMHSSLSSLLRKAESFLDHAGFDRAPWLAVALGLGITAWFVMPGPIWWIGTITGGIIASIAAAAIWRDIDDRSRLRQAIISVTLTFAIGMILIWLRSAAVGQEPFESPRYGPVQARVLERIEQPAQERIRLVVAARDAETGRAIRLRVNVPDAEDRPGLSEGALVRFNARLMPPAPPMLPGGYNFARTAWFEGYAATGSAVGQIDVLERASGASPIARAQRSLSSHVRSQLSGAPGAIAATFASGDRGAIGPADEEAMRDAGLTHLLSISGLHVSAVIAAAYLIAIKILAAWPWLVLRVRLPIVAASLAALAGIGYTLLTGAQVPTVRSCVGALLVLIALALGREPLSLRMVAVAASVVMFLWPETLVGPSFQMSFSAVIAIVALHNSAWVKSFLAPREERWLARTGRRGVMLLVTGMVIELALMPIVLFHFHRSGLYGAFANVLAIPLVTFISMPLIALALVLDIVGLGGPVWWMAGHSLDGLLALAHFTSAQPGAVKLSPAMSLATFALFASGLLWLALWKGRSRLWGLLPVAAATVALLATPVPDLMITGDGRHVGITEPGGRLLVLRESRSSYTSDNLKELAATQADPISIRSHEDAQCSRDFCVITLHRNDRDWSIMMALSKERIEERALAAACERTDIVIADRWLPRSCRPKWLKADRNLLNKTGGLSIDLSSENIASVAERQGQHGWWRPREPYFQRRKY